MYQQPDRQNTDGSFSRSSRRSNGSWSSQSTRATSFDDEPLESKRPCLERYSGARPWITHSDRPSARQYSYDDDITVSVASSLDNYDRALEESYHGRFHEDLFDEPEEIPYNDYEYTPSSQNSTCYAPSASAPSYTSTLNNISFEAIPTSPDDFAKYFPTSHRLNIQHDPTAEDGNMNLLVTTEVPDGGRKYNMQLFHLRMHDLAAREFSLRRYCRDSGREVAHSVVKQPAAQRPAFGRGLSNALASLKRTNSGGSNMSPKSTATTKSMLSSQDSGYDSVEEYESGSEDGEMVEEDYSAPSSPENAPTNTIKLEFSNYAQVDIKRRGQKANKHWDFEYWGTQYSWKRTLNRDAAMGKTYMYHLYKADSQEAVAHIFPELRTVEEQREDEAVRGLVPPCILKISDAKILSSADISDVVVASGLIALTDDCVRRLTKKQSQATKKPAFGRQLSFKVGKTEKLDVEFVTPRKMMEHMFSGSKKLKLDTSRPGTPKRKGTGKSEKAGSPLKNHTPAPVGAY